MDKAESNAKSRTGLSVSFVYVSELSLLPVSSRVRYAMRLANSS